MLLEDHELEEIRAEYDNNAGVIARLLSHIEDQEQENFGLDAEIWDAENRIQELEDRIHELEES